MPLTITNARLGLRARTGVEPTRRKRGRAILEPKESAALTGSTRLVTVASIMSAARPELDVTSVPTSDPLVGRVLQDRYEILHQIGEGGMGAVYAARHLLIGNKVAVKVLHAHYAHDPRVVERFRREAQATTRIGHHHIVSVFDFGQHENQSL